MEWLMTFLGRRRKLSDDGTELHELVKINTRLERLEKHELILNKLNAIEIRLANFNQDDINKLRVEVSEINKKLKIASEPKTWPIIKEFEEQFDGKVAAYTCYGLLIVFAVALWFYLHANNNHDTIEYASYIFPITAAIFAGLTVYHDNLKGTLFTISLILLILGVDTFIAIHVDSDDVIAGTNFALYILLFSALVVRGVKAFGRARTAKQVIPTVQQLPPESPSSPSRVALFYGGVGFFFLALLCFTGAFYSHNRACIHAQGYPAMRAACSGSMWPSFYETVTWPITVFD